MVQIMINGKITPELRSKFLTAINKTRETGNEHGFFICEDKKGLVPSNIRSGTKNAIDLGDSSITCNGKKLGADFHTHAYFTTFKNARSSPEIREKLKLNSDQDIKNFLRQEHNKYTKDFDGLTINSPSVKDLLKSALRKCTGTSHVTTCVSSDMGDGEIECWTVKDISSEDCDTIYKKLFENGKEKDMVNYDNKLLSLFEKDKINIKGD